MKKLLALLFFCSLGMSEVVISPNMNLPVPVVGSTPGPDWANNINSCMSSIDSHDHTPGHGVQISSSALDISSDLALNNNSLTEAKSVVFDAQPSFSTRQAIYVISPDLIYNDGNGNVIRITQGGSVSGSAGTITGLPSGTASASYQSVGGTFQFQSATNTPANGTFASLSVAQQTTSPNTITIKSPNSLGASYNFTLPTSVPSFTSLLTMSTSGVLATVPYHTPTIQTFTSGSGTYTTPTSPGPTYIRVRMVGGGGGGAARSGAGSNGVDSSFGTALLVAGAGSGGGAGASGGGAGAGGSLGSGPIGSTFIGSRGGAGGGNTAATVQPAGGNGGSTAFGGGGGGGEADHVGYAGAANTGGGGGGCGGGAGAVSGSGGGGAGVVDAIINGPAVSYSYVVGTGGAGGTGGGFSGGAGGSGYIEVTEYYQ